jgi:cell wall assembly regulator SMI1
MVVRHDSVCSVREYAVSVCGIAAEPAVAPDRAAILVLRDTAPLQAARQVNAVVRRLFRGIPMARKRPLTVAEAWDVIHRWLDTNARSLRPKLNKPATKTAIAALEKTVGLQLPDDFKASYLIHDGADSYSGPIIGVPFMPVAKIEKEWKLLKPKKGDIYQELEKEVSYVKGMIKEDANNPKWIPFAGPDEQNYIGLDFDPGPKGTPGQVINFGADEFIYGSNRFVMASSFGEFMGFLAEQFATGKVEVCPDNDPDDQRFLQLVRRREGGAACNLLTGAAMVFGDDREK